MTQSAIITGRGAAEGTAWTRSVTAVALDNYPSTEKVLKMAAIIDFTPGAEAASITGSYIHLGSFIGMPKSLSNLRFSSLQIRIMSRVASPD